MTVFVVATAGHVDHGKSTLVRALTGTDPDRFEEEKRRGLTIDLGFARFTTASGVEVDLVDVPGHVRFLKNMLAGVSAVDACLLVVAANEGWMRQTEEHLRILDLLGVESGVVALTMARSVDEDELELARMEVTDRVAGSFLDGAEVVAVDAPSDGFGLAHMRHALDRLVATLARHAENGRPRLWVDRSFAVAGAGTVVTGTLTGGRLRVGDEITVVTADSVLRARSRGLQAFGRDHEVLEPGCRAAVNLAGIGHRAIARGHAVVRPGQWHLSRQFDAALRVLPTAPRSVKARGAWFAYIGSGEHVVRVCVLGGVSSIAPGEHGAVRITLPVALPLLPGDRFVLGTSSSSLSIVAGGEVLDVDPVLRPSHARPDRSVDRVVIERGWVEADEVEKLTGERREPIVGRWLVSQAALDATRRDVRERARAATSPGLDVALLGDLQRAVVESDGTLAVANGRVTPVAAADLYVNHPFLAVLRAAPYSPPSPAEAGVDWQDVRELLRRGLAVERDGIVFAAAALDGVARVAADLLADEPDGYTVTQLREALGTTRKFAMPLVALLDANGFTRRRGDVHISGPRLQRLKLLRS